MIKIKPGGEKLKFCKILPENNTKFMRLSQKINFEIPDRFCF